MRVCLPILVVLVASALSLQGQGTDIPEANTGSIVGTVTTVNRDALAGAKIVLEGTGDRRTAVSDDNGFFEFHNIQPGIPYHITINAEGFERWTSPTEVIEPKALVDVVTKFANKKKATPAQIALAWILAQKPWMVPIPGTTKVHRLEENLGAIDVQLTGDNLRELDVAASKIEVKGERYPESAQRMINR